MTMISGITLDPGSASVTKTLAEDQAAAALAAATAQRAADQLAADEKANAAAAQLAVDQAAVTRAGNASNLAEMALLAAEKAVNLTA